MKRSSQSIHSNEILEALAESILEIDSQYQKVQKLKKLLISQNKPSISPVPNSYASRYQLSHKKNTMSMRNLPEPSLMLPKSASKECLIEKKPDRDELFIRSKEQEIRSKAEKAKLDEKMLNSLEIKAKSLENDLKAIEFQSSLNSSFLSKQISTEICRNIVFDIIHKALTSSISKKTAQLYSQKSILSSMYTKQSNLTAEIQLLLSNFSQEWQDFEKSKKNLQEKEENINQALSKLLNDSKSLQESKQSLTLRQREEQLRAKEIIALNKIKTLNQQKTLLDSKAQKLSISQKSPLRATNPSVRESKLATKESQLQEIEAKLAVEELEVEEKRKKIMEKWEKMIGKVDDANKNKNKISVNQQGIEEKYKEFLSYKKECELKLSTQETLLVNQEINFLRKIAKLEGADDLQRDSLEESTEDTFSKQFIERQKMRKKELEDISNKKKQITLTISSFLSELN